MFPDVVRSCVWKASGSSFRDINLYCIKLKPVKFKWTADQNIYLTFDLWKAEFICLIR